MSQSFEEANDTSNAAKPSPFKSNINIDEVRAMLVYMETNSITTAAIEFKNTGIGSTLRISNDWDSDQKDITNYGCW